MALEGTQLNSGSGGDVLATDIVSGKTYQVVKIGVSKEDILPVPVSSKDRLPVSIQTDDDSDNVDAFGRWRISEPHTLFDSKLLGSDNQPLFWDESLESGAGITASTSTAAKPYIDFTSSLNTAGKYTRQTFRRFNYQPGKSQLILMTGVLDLSGGGTGVERRIGYFDDNNGAFFEDDAGTIGVTTRSNDTGTPVDTTVAQSSWNIDVMDGTGDSGITIDWAKAQIFVIDFQWLSVGSVRFGLEVSGHTTYVHEVSVANISAVPWCSTPNLPLRYQIITTSSSPVSTQRCICSVVISEGGLEENGLVHSHSTTDHVNANTADIVYALLGIRLKATHVGCTIVTEKVSILAETADDFEWLLIHNSTVAGTFAYSDKSNSCVQIATGNTDNPSTNTVTSGTIITRGFGSGNSAIELAGIRNTLTLGVAIDGSTLDTLVLAVRPLGVNADIQGSLTWEERF